MHCVGLVHPRRVRPNERSRSLPGTLRRVWLANNALPRSCLEHARPRTNAASTFRNSEVFRVAANCGFWTRKKSCRRVVVFRFQRGAAVNFKKLRRVAIAEQLAVGVRNRFSFRPISFAIRGRVF